MGHPGNWSERKLAEVESAERSKRAHGWWRAGPRDNWTHVDSPAGVLARNARLSARCGSHDCSRRIRFDPHFWIARGMGDTQLGVIRTAYMCARTPCGLQWQGESYPRGVPLIAYTALEGAEVSVACGRCQKSKTYTAQQFVDRLIAAGRSPNVPGWDLHGCVQGACRTCGERQWTVTLRVPGRVITAPPGVLE